MEIKNEIVIKWDDYENTRIKANITKRLIKEQNKRSKNKTL